MEPWLIFMIMFLKAFTLQTQLLLANVVHQGCSQEFQKGVSINGRIIIKQVSLGVQLQMLTNRTRVNFEFNTFLPNKSIIIL